MLAYVVGFSCCSEQLPYFARLQAMMSLEEKNILRSPRTVLPHFLMGGQSRERGGNLSPYDDIKGRFQIGPSELSFSQRDVQQENFIYLIINKNSNVVKYYYYYYLK